MTAELVSATDGGVLWSEGYDREMKDVFAVQEEIAQAIVKSLQVKLGASGGPLVRRSTTDIAAYELYLKGRYFVSRVTPDDLRRAIGYFEQAIARDSSYAQAYAGLADAYLLIAIFSGAPPQEPLMRVKAAAAKAIAQDSTLAEAHAALATVLFAFDWDWPGAGREFARALALDPGYAYAHHRYGLWLMYQGRLDEAETSLNRARSLDPLTPSIGIALGRLYLARRRPEQAIQFMRAALELSPFLPLAHEQIGHAYLLQGKRVEALAAFKRAATLSLPRDSAQLAYALAVTGERDEAKRVIRDLLDSSKRRQLPAMDMAMAYGGLGDPDAAFRWLEQGYAERASLMHTLKIAPGFDSLRTDPRWATLLRKIGLEP